MLMEHTLMVQHILLEVRTSFLRVIAQKKALGLRKTLKTNPPDSATEIPRRKPTSPRFIPLISAQGN